MSGRTAARAIGTAIQPDEIGSAIKSGATLVTDWESISESGFYYSTIGATNAPGSLAGETMVLGISL